TAVVAGGTAAAVKAKHEKKKGKEVRAAAEPEQMWALDQLALQQAYAILEANGIELPEQEEKKAASEAEQAALDQAVSARAVQMLTEAGYQFEEAEEAAEKE